MTTAADLLAVVRVHADRVHDAVRRLGCGPDDALQVVERSANDLVDAARGGQLDDPVGWWFARARVLARQVAGTGDDDLPVGGGVLSTDTNQVRLAEALESRPERERAALLLRDSYDLPAGSVATVLGLDAHAAMEVVGAARLAFLPALLGGAPLSLAGHAVDLAALARLSEGGPVAAADATTRRHAQSCDRCADALDAMERSRRLLAGLAVVAMPDAEREALLLRLGARTAQALPAAVAVEEVEEEWEDEPRRPYSLSLIALGLVVALGLGIGGGILASRPGRTSVDAQVRSFGQVTQAPPLVVPVTRPSPTAPPSVSAAPRVTFLPPSLTPSPTPPAVTGTATVAPTETATSDATITLDPTSGPNHTQITVTGNGWLPGTTINISYRTQLNAVGAQASATSDAAGFFQATISADDPQGLPGDHQVVVDDGSTTRTATFSQT